MAFDIIVFSQQELLQALKAGVTSIGLCDNTFVLPLTENISYTAIGEVYAFADATEEEFAKKGIVCGGFSPRFKDAGISADASALPAASSYAASASSFISSYFMSSYFMTSYITSYVTSYMYRYEYEYETGASFASSYASSYVSSYSASFSASMSSFLMKFGTSVGSDGEMCVMVNGYGVNLI
ncbi:MAG: hypothetical protein LUF26_01595 [Firmicutes bacterium]|nr:hypothetical protein [Bacillota bacterium]